MYTDFLLLWHTQDVIICLMREPIAIDGQKNKHYFYHGAIITERNVPSSVSLGMFVFTTTNPMKDKRTKNKIPDEELSKRLLVHEYGHTIQSLIFGPLYLIVMGIPSTLWGFLPCGTLC